MQDAATRARCEDAPRHTLWHAIPLELIVSGLAIFLAAGLKIAGVMP